ncbi:ATP-binding protein [Actinophytocola sp.]|uniref:ATP-binding protein n=1 Tax=Actinophytocola sp. TaxID=1872138 RepID=UPI003D6BC175
MTSTGEPLVGRERVVAQVRSAVADVAAGTGGCVLIEGPTGIGKTRLLEFGLAQARENAVAVASARATEYDRIAPLHVLLSALRGGARPVLDDVTFNAIAEREVNRFWQLDRLAERIEEAAMDTPLVVAIDDVQWADELTALALRTLVPELGSAPVLWLIAHRVPQPRSPVTDAVAWLVAEGATRLSLGQLSAGEVAKFCAYTLGAVPDDTVLALAHGSGGNPFLLNHLLRTLRDEGQLRVDDYTASVVNAELPASFLGVVEHRLRDLGPTVRRLLDVASVIGRRFTLHEAAGLAGVPAVQLLPAVEEAVRLGLLVDSGDQFSFGHDIIREAVYHSLPGPVRYALHREAATVLRHEGRGVAEVAEHVVRSARKGDLHAVEVLRQAAMEIAERAPGTAADLLLRALDLLGDDEAVQSGGDDAGDTDQLLADAVRLLASVGRLSQARRLGAQALRRGLAPDAEATILVGMAEALKHAGEDAAAVQTTTRAMERPALPESARADLLAVRAHALLYVDDVAGADQAGAMAAELGRHAGEYAAVVFGTVARTMAAMCQGRLADAVQFGHDAVALADRAGGAAKQRHPVLWLGRAMVAAERFTEADALFENGQREADSAGTAWTQPLWHYYRAELRLAAGRLDDAAAEAEAGLAVTERLSAQALTVPLLGMLAELSLRRDELSDAAALLERARGLRGGGIGAMREELDWVAALVREAAGDPAGAFELLADTYAAMPDRLLLLVTQPWAGPQLVRMALENDAKDAASVIVSAAAGLAEKNRGVAALVGACAHAHGLYDNDINALRTAVAAYRDSPRLLALAAALEDLARADATAARTTSAVTSFTEAGEIYARCGARRDQARVSRALRGLGIRRRALSTTRTVKVGWHSLTDAELKVARLVAQGLTNRATASRLFLSPHTVDTHLRHAFAKLGVTSRVELTRQVLAHDETGDTSS